MDIPESAKHKNHKVPIPLTGGVVLIILVTIMTLLTGIWENPQLLGILASAMIIVIFGLLDDFFDLTPSKKLFGQILASIF